MFGGNDWKNGDAVDKFSRMILVSVPNEVYTKLYEDESVQNIIHSVSKKYSKTLKYDELKQCGRIGLFKALKSYKRGKSKFTTHLYRWVRWECQRECEISNKYEGITFSYDINSIIDPPTKLNDILDDLEGKYKNFLIYRHIYRMSNKEIAKKLRISVSTVKNRMKKALKFAKTQ